MIDYQKLFNLFVGTDDMRTLFHKPFKSNGKYGATDAHSLIFIPCDKLDVSFITQEEAPDIDYVIPMQETCHIEIKVTDIERQLTPEIIDEEIEVEDETKCAECDGDGEVEWSYNSYDRMDDCPECGGNGVIEKSIMKKTGRKVVKDTAVFELLGVVFTYKELRRLIDAAQIIGAETIIKVFGEQPKGNLFIVADFKILVMPFLTEGEVTKINIQQEVIK